MIYIVEPKHEGHHMALYVRAYIDALYAKNRVITLLTSPQGANAAIIMELKNEFPNLKIQVIPRLFQNSLKDSTIFGQFLLWLRLRLYFQSNRSMLPITLVFPTLDSFLMPLALFGAPARSCKWVGVYMSPPKYVYADRRKAPVRSGVITYLLGRLIGQRCMAGLITVLPDFHQALCSRFYSEAKKLHLAPDFVNFSDDTKSANCKTPDWSANKKILLVYGALSERKGIREVSDAIKSELWPKDWHVVFAGRPASDALETLDLCRLSNHVTMFLSFQDLSEEAMLFRAATAVWAYYPEHTGSSGVVNLAAAYRKPVLASGNHLRADAYAKFEDGVLLDNGGVCEIIQALADIDRVIINDVTTSSAQSSRIIHQDLVCRLVK